MDRAQCTTLDARLLRRWPLPEVPENADKEVRGRVLVVAGSREIAGAALALAVPEARVIALPETSQGAFATSGLTLLEESAGATDAALVGPGLMAATGTRDFVAGLLPLLAQTPVVLDALAMEIVRREEPLAQPVLLTPHAGEMTHLNGMSKEAVLKDPQRAAAGAAR